MKPFELAPLPYAYDYLEPVIDAETMKLHHDKHHQAYVNNLNAAIAKYPDLPYGCVDLSLIHISITAENRISFSLYATFTRRKTYNGAVFK